MPSTALPDAVQDNVIQGRAVAKNVRAEVRQHTDALAAGGVELKLVVVRVGADPASEIYVRHKRRACAEVGILSEELHLPPDISEAELLARIATLDADADVDGILVQLPLPPHISSQAAIAAVAPGKDVDGFHPVNLGGLMEGTGALEACTPKGVMALLCAAGVETRGRHAVVVGRSVIVGRPIAQMLIRADATVTVCHRYTPDLDKRVSDADIVVVATGVPHLVKGAWIRPGAAVIDVGITRLADGRIVGDVEFDVARERAGAITPVPGGVGPMTIAMLLWNTLVAGTRRRGLAPAPLMPTGVQVD